MIVMPSNNTSGLCHYLAGAYPGRIGLLISPKGWRIPPRYFPWAMDNGAFTDFDPELFCKCLDRAKHINRPIFVAVPDALGDAEETSRLWKEWSGKINFPLAFVAQDGHEPQDVPKDAFAVFVGGTSEWKLSNAHKFKGVAKWLHIGRVNTGGRLKWANECCEADSVDGTGFFRGDQKQKQDLIDYVSGGRGFACEF